VRFCGERLPEELLFSEEEKKRVDEDLAELRKRRKQVLPDIDWGVDSL
jgi:hypothetical protein